MTIITFGPKVSGAKNQVGCSRCQRTQGAQQQQFGGTTLEQPTPFLASPKSKKMSGVDSRIDFRSRFLNNVPPSHPAGPKGDPAAAGPQRPQVQRPPPGLTLDHGPQVPFGGQNDHRYHQQAMQPGEYWPNGGSSRAGGGGDVAGRNGNPGRPTGLTLGPPVLEISLAKNQVVFRCHRTQGVQQPFDGTLEEPTPFLVSPKSKKMSGIDPRIDFLRFLNNVPPSHPAGPKGGPAAAGPQRPQVQRPPPGLTLDHGPPVPFGGENGHRYLQQAMQPGEYWPNGGSSRAGGGGDVAGRNGNPGRPTGLTLGPPVLEISLAKNQVVFRCHRTQGVQQPFDGTLEEPAPFLVSPKSKKMSGIDPRIDFLRFLNNVPPSHPAGPKGGPAAAGPQRPQVQRPPPGLTLDHGPPVPFGGENGHRYLQQAMQPGEYWPNGLRSRAGGGGDVAGRKGNPGRPTGLTLGPPVLEISLAKNQVVFRCHRTQGVQQPFDGTLEEPTPFLVSPKSKKMPGIDPRIDVRSRFLNNVPPSHPAGPQGDPAAAGPQRPQVQRPPPGLTLDHGPQVPFGGQNDHRHHQQAMQPGEYWPNVGSSRAGGGGDVAGRNGNPGCPTAIGPDVDSPRDGAETLLCDVHTWLSVADLMIGWPQWMRKVLLASEKSSRLPSVIPPLRPKSVLPVYCQWDLYSHWDLYKVNADVHGKAISGGVTMKPGKYLARTLYSGYGLALDGMVRMELGKEVFMPERYRDSMVLVTMPLFLPTHALVQPQRNAWAACSPPFTRVQVFGGAVYFRNNPTFLDCLWLTIGHDAEGNAVELKPKELGKHLQELVGLECLLDDVAIGRPLRKIQNIADKTVRRLAIEADVSLTVEEIELLSEGAKQAYGGRGGKPAAVGSIFQWYNEFMQSRVPGYKKLLLVSH